jgi:hypothetical protein
MMPQVKCDRDSTTTDGLAERRQCFGGDDDGVAKTKTDSTFPL